MVLRQSNGRVLAVDNDELVTRALMLRLEDAGYTCQTASSGAQALSLLRGMPFDLIITDLNMPCGSGSELIHSVRQSSEIPIIVLTGFADHWKTKLIGKGVTVLRKPFDIQAILDLVELECLGSRSRHAA